MKFLPRQRWPEVTIPAAWKSSTAHFGRPSAVSLIYGVIKARVVLMLQPETRREQVTTQLFADDHPIKTQHKSMKRNLTLIRVLRFCKNLVRPLCWICNELNFRFFTKFTNFLSECDPGFIQDYNSGYCYRILPEKHRLDEADQICSFYLEAELINFDSNFEVESFIDVLEAGAVTGDLGILVWRILAICPMFNGSHDFHLQLFQL